jgi:hypothetical protein
MQTAAARHRISSGIVRLSWSWPGIVPVVGGGAFPVSAGSKRFPQRRQTKERSHMLLSFGYSSRLKSEACLKSRPPKAAKTRKRMNHRRLLAAIPIAKNKKAGASRQPPAVNSFCFGGASSCARSELCSPVVPAAPTPRLPPPRPTPMLASLMVDVPSLKTTEKRRTSSLWQVGQVRGMAADKNMESSSVGRKEAALGRRASRGFVPLLGRGQRIGLSIFVPPESPGTASNPTRRSARPWRSGTAMSRARGPRPRCWTSRRQRRADAQLHLSYDRFLPNC